MTERYKTNEVGCIVDLKTLENYDGQEIVDLLNILAEKNEQVINFVNKRLNKSLSDYEKSVKGGMPTSEIESEIELLQKINELIK